MWRDQVVPALENDGTLETRLRRSRRMSHHDSFFVSSFTFRNSSFSLLQRLYLIFIKEFRIKCLSRFSLRSCSVFIGSHSSINLHEVLMAIVPNFWMFLPWLASVGRCRPPNSGSLANGQCPIGSEDG
jgi:hypothetical protein